MNEEVVSRLRRLSLALAEVEQRERDRIATLLHDELQQILVAAQFKAARLADTKIPTSKMRSQAKEIVSLIDQCLNTSRDLSVELSPPVLRGAPIREMIQWLAERFQEKHGLQVTVRGVETLLEVDPAVRLVLFQAVRELLFNIVKHSGQLSAEIELDQEEGWILVQVRDSGRGFDPEILKDTLQRGTGLSNIEERLEAIRGRWEIESAPGGGARFRLWFPSEKPSDRADSNDPSQSVSLVRLLIVDDHKMVREGIGSLLEEEPDFVVVGEATNGKEAIAFVEELEPDVVIMDIEMPVMDGIEATRAILKKRPETSIVGLSMHDRRGYAEQMKKAGAAAHEDKAKASVRLIETIRRVYYNENR